MLQGTNSTLSFESKTSPSQLLVTGTASLGGTLNLDVDNGLLTVGKTRLVHADAGVSGSFSQITGNLVHNTYLTQDVNYDANNVFLTLNPTAAAFSDSYPDHASVTGLSVAHSFDELLGTGGGAPVQAPERRGIWGQFGTVSGGLGATDFAIHGATVGIGLPLNDTFDLGAAISAAATSTSQSPMQMTAAPFGGFVYGVFHQDGWRIAGSVGAGLAATSSSRELTSLGTTQKSSGNGHYFGAALRGSWTARSGSMAFSPYAGIDFISGNYGSAQETGTSLLALDFGALNQNLTHYQAGVKVSDTWTDTQSDWTSWASLGVEGWGGDHAPSVQETLGTATHTAQGASLPSVALNTSVGLTVASKDWDASLSWQGAFGDGYHSNGFKLSLKHSL